MRNPMTAEDMKNYLFELPEQFSFGLQMELPIPTKYRRDDHNVVICGMGGSAIGGDILRTLAYSRSAIPIIVCRSYELPAFINEKTLVLAVSYSGNTEETLEAYRIAGEKGAQIMVVSSGGKLSQLAQEEGQFVINIPGKLVPRAASGYLFVPLALVLDELGILSGIKPEIEETVKVLKQLREQIGPQADMRANLARNIAADLKGNIPLIWGATATSEIAAQRWKGQINENSKSLAFYNLFPELNHNEIVGFEMPEDLLKRLVVIILRDQNDHDQVKKRMQITAEVIKGKINKVIEVWPQGNSFLARYYSLAYIGDYTSYYLALEYGINPTPVKVIDFLKTALADNH